MCSSDLPFILSWALMPATDPVDGFRGPHVTSDLPMRHGAFRSLNSAFRTDITNIGWTLSDTAPYRDLDRMINPAGYTGKYPAVPGFEIVPDVPLFGAELRARVQNQIRRQIGLGFLMEQLPDPANRVTVDPRDRKSVV